MPETWKPRGHRGFATPADEAAFFASYDALLARWPVPVEHVDVPSVHGTTRVNVCGPAGAPPLVLLHGGGATSAVWFANVAALSRAHRVHAIDVIGQAGRSVHDGAPINGAADLSDWLDDVLDRLGVTGACLVGHSYGGWISLDHALRAHAAGSGRVDSLVLLDPSMCFTGQRPGYLLHAAPLMLAPSPRRLRALLAWEAGDTDRLDAGWLDLAARATAFPASPIVLPRRPAAERLRGLPVPTLVLTAEHSRQHDIGRLADAAGSLLPQVTTMTLPDVSHHSLPFRHADRLDAAITAFLAPTG